MPSPSRHQAGSSSSPLDPPATAPAQLSHELERWLAGRRREDARQPDRGVRGEELRAAVRVPARCAGSAASNRRRDARVRGHRRAARRSADRRKSSDLASGPLVQARARGKATERFISGLMKLIRGLERLSRPRLRFIFNHRLSNVVFGLLVIGGSARSLPRAAVHGLGHAARARGCADLAGRPARRHPCGDHRPADRPRGRRARDRARQRRRERRQETVLALTLTSRMRPRYAEACVWPSLPARLEPTAASRSR